MYAREAETREGLKQQHQLLFNAIMEGRADNAREIAGTHIQYVQQVLSERSESHRRLERAIRRDSLTRS